MHNPEGRYHRASWLPVIAADILPIVRLDIRNERIHILDILHVDDSPDLLKLFGSHQHVTCTRYGINDIHGRPAMFFDGLPEIVGKFGRHGISQGGRWMIPVYLNRLMKARNIGREPSIGSRPEDDGPLGQLVDSLSPSKSEKRRRFPPENRSDTDFLSTRRTLSWALADKPSSSMAALSVDVHTPKANVQYTTLDRKPLKSVRNRHQTNTILNTSHEPKSTTVLELKYRSYEMFTIIQEFTEKYRGFRGSLFSIHPLSGCERLLFGFLIHWRLPLPIVTAVLVGPLRLLGAFCLVAGLALDIWAVATFRRAGTTPHPAGPTTTLAVGGPYRFTRNPMYLALVFITASLALLANALWPLILLPVVIVIVRRAVIDREERYLTTKFGEEYLQTS